ncbi:MAG: tetratricopeptide repeat protein [Acidobacteriota bacterium]
MADGGAARLAALTQELHRAARAACEELTAELVEPGLRRLEGDVGLARLTVERAASVLGRPLVVLALDGYEPDLGSLEPFARLCRALAGDSVDDDDSAEAGTSIEEGAAAPPSDEPPISAVRAAGIALGFDGWSGAEAADLETALGRLDESIVFVPQVAELPASLRRRLKGAVGHHVRLILHDDRSSMADAAAGASDFAAIRLPELTEPPRALEQSRLDAIFDAAGEVGAVARGLLDAIALADGRLPIDPLLAAGGLDLEQRDAVIDFLDEVLVERLGLLVDLEYLHPGFRSAVYRLAAPGLAVALRSLRPPEDRARRAGELHAALARRLSPTRAAVATLARLARRAGEASDAGRWWAMLAGWATRGEAQEAVEALAEELDAGQLDPRGLWFAMERAEHWPTGRRRVAWLAIARRAGGLPDDLQVAHALVGAELARREGRADEAAASAREARDAAIARHGRRSVEYLAAAHLSGQLSAEVAPGGAARDLLREARDLGRELLPADDPRRIVLEASLGETMRAMGELRAARAPLEEAVLRAEAIHGSGRPETALHRRTLASLLAEIGELEAARDTLERALPALLSQPPHPAAPLVALDLAEVASRLGEEATAREAAERAADLLAGIDPRALRLDAGSLGELTTRFERHLGELDETTRLRLQLLGTAASGGTPPGGSPPGGPPA